MNPYQPPALFKNRHIHSIFSSAGPRKLLVRKRSRQLLEESVPYILDCGDGIRLQGSYASRPTNDKGLVIIIHGWLGCDESLYVLSASNRLYAEGYNIFRLNLRDHGDTAHLNKGLFNSTRLDEVVNAVREIQRLLPSPHNFLAGYSLGGNFSLRVAARASNSGLRLNQVVAVCPVINPYKTNRNLNEGPMLYHHYFRNKWRKSLLKKIEHFPEYDYASALKDMRTLDEMNDYFVPNHTAYDDVDEYLMGYAIGGEHLAALDQPCHIISSQDDPVIAAADLQELADNPNLQIELTEFGGHCGYLSDWRLNSWVDTRMLELFAAAVQAKG